MCKYQHKNIIINCQDNISVLKPNNTTTIGLENYNITEAQDKAFKIAFMNIIEGLKEETNKHLKESYKNTNRGRK